MSLKQLYQRFRNWQRNPRQYPELGSEMHYCNNCGQEYDGTFCPRCGQKARAGRITWDVVRRGVMDVWGLGGRSLPYSLWQLLWRPGYFISDYISGKWQTSFPPFKMLVLVALAIYIIGRAIFPEYWNVIIEIDTESITSTGWQYYIDYIGQWIGNHLEWMFLFIFSFLIIPTWFLFRHSPRNPRHTLPQGFFIQVFLTTQYIMWLFFISLCIKLMGVNTVGEAGHSRFVDLVNLCSVLLVPVLVLVNYKQLFGYSWWGTVWREIVMMMASLALCISIIILLAAVKSSKLLMIDVFCISLLGLILSLADIVNRRRWRERAWLRVMVIPLLFLLLLAGMGFIVERIKPGVLTEIFGAFFEVW